MKKGLSILGVESTLALRKHLLFAISLVIPLRTQRMPYKSGLGNALYRINMTKNNARKKRYISPFILILTYLKEIIYY
jgi:hypothetical protein